jgi:hypothetical protein
MDGFVVCWLIKKRQALGRTIITGSGYGVAWCAATAGQATKDGHPVLHAQSW